MTIPPRKKGQNWQIGKAKKITPNSCGHKHGLLRANDGIMLVNDGELLVNDGEMLVNDGEMNI